VEAALVAFCLLVGDLGGQPSVTSETGGLETPGETGFLPGILALQASVASEFRAGEAPLLPGAVSQPFVAEILIPRLDLELRNRDLVFSSWYAPRIFWEDPRPPAASATLVLHTLGLTLAARTSRNVAVTASAGGSIGAPDYTTLPQVLGTVQPTLPPVIELAAVNGQARVVAKLTQRWGLSLVGQASHWQWLDIPPTVTVGTVTSETAVTGEPAATFLLTARDTLGLGAALGWFEYSYDAGAFTVTPAATWKRHLARGGTDLNVRLGLTYVHALGSPPLGALPVLGVGRTEAVSPIASADITFHLARREETMLLGRASAGVDYYLDPVLGIAVPRGSTSAELIAVSVPSWTTTLRGDFATALQSVSVPPTQAPPDETAFSLSLSVRRRVTENLYAELGGRWANRGPTLDTPDFRFDQRQLWGYLSLIATTRPIPRPALPRE
jgi:hypothetical protein